MKNLIYIYSFALFVACSSNNDTFETSPNNIEICDTISTKGNNMEVGNLYLDSLTPIQRSCVEKAFRYHHDPTLNHDDGPYACSVWDAKGYLTEDEKDAIVELSIWDLKGRYNAVDVSQFNRRMKDVFGYDFESFSKDLERGYLGKKYSDNLIAIFLGDPITKYADHYTQFYISKKERIITACYGIAFDKFDEIKTFIPPSRFDGGTVLLGTYANPVYVSHVDYMYHLNKFLFNEAGASRTWLLVNDPYFMVHLLIQFGYDGDKDINEMTLKKYQEKDAEMIDMPVNVFHLYPNGKIKLLDNLLNAAAEMSTAECADYFNWATSIVNSFCIYKTRMEEKSESSTYGDDTEEEESDEFMYIKKLTLSQKREIVAHVVNYMQPVYEKYIESSAKYGSQDSDLGDLHVIDCFWNYMMDDYEVIADMENKNYYGLPNLKSLILSMKDFKPFYNSETGEFEPWNFVPMRYQ